MCERLERQVLDLLAALHHVFGRIDVAARVQAHVHPAHDLPRPAGSVVLLENLHLELHVLLEAGRRAHGKVLGVELETDVDDFFDR